MGLTRHHPPSQVVDAFGVDFKYRRFDAREAAPRNADLLAGTKRVAAVHPWESSQAASPPPPPCLSRPPRSTPPPSPPVPRSGRETRIYESSWCRSTGCTVPSDMSYDVVPTTIGAAAVQ